MGRRLIPLTLIVLAVPLLGTTACGPTLVSPTSGYIVVPHVLSRVRIETSGLDG